MINLKLHWQILIAMILGIALGVIFQNIHHGNLVGTIYTLITSLGVIFVRLLKMIIVPLIFTSIVTGVSGIGSGKSLGRVGLKTFFYYLTTSLFAILIGLSLTNLIQPGKGVPLGEQAVEVIDKELIPEEYFIKVESSPDLKRILEELKQGVSIPGVKLIQKQSAFDSTLLNKPGSPADILIRMIPLNPFSAAASGDMLGIIFFAIFLGVGITRIDSKHSKILRNFFNSTFEVMMNITQIIIKFAPLGVLGLITEVVSKSGFGLFTAVAKYMLTIAGGLSIHFLIVLPLLFYFTTGINPRQHFSAMASALATAFSTSSSNATLPVTMRCIEKNAGVSNKVSSFVLPMGATINMDGTALYECAGVLFISQVLGIDLTISNQFTIVITALLASIGAAGIPSAGLVMIFIVTQAVGFQDADVAVIIGIMLAVDRPLDMMRTMVNIFSDSIGASVIAHSEGETLYQD